MTADFVYQLPLGTGKRWLSSGRVGNLIFGGWEISAIFAASTGQFLTPLWTGPDPTGAFNTSNTTPAQVTIRPNLLSNPNLPDGQRAVNGWFNVNAFGPPAPGYFGSSGKGVILGPGSWIIDSGVAKNFAIGDRARARLEMQGTNILNHPNWGNLGMNISTIGSAGVITSVGYGSGTTEGTGLDATAQRGLRLGLRLEW